MRRWGKAGGWCERSKMEVRFKVSCESCWCALGQLLKSRCMRLPFIEKAPRHIATALVPICLGVMGIQLKLDSHVHNTVVLAANDGIFTSSGLAMAKAT